VLVGSVDETTESEYDRSCKFYERFAWSQRKMEGEAGGGFGAVDMTKDGLRLGVSMGL